MNFAHFFIDRPVFAAVLSIVTVVIGGLAAYNLPLERHPQIAPPTIIVTANYPGADARIVAETVATPIEQQVNGVENMLYMSSQSTNDGQMQITVTFQLGTDLDIAQVQVQNRVALAEPSLPEEVRRQGITVRKSSPDLTLIINIVSPDQSRDIVYLSNYALIAVRDRLTRLPGAGDVVLFGPRDYSMRAWLNPELLASRNLTAADVVAAIRNQNVQVAAGTVGQPPTRGDIALQLTVRTQGRLFDAEEFGAIIVRRGEAGQLVRVRDVARVELGAANEAARLYLDSSPTVGVAVFQLPGTNALETKYAITRTMEELAKDFPSGVDYVLGYDVTVFIEESLRAVVKVLLEAVLVVTVVVLIFLQSWRATLIPMLAVPVSLIGTCAVMAALGHSLNTLSLMALVLAIGIVVDDAIVVVENVERNLEEGLDPRSATRKAMSEVSSPVVATALVLTAVFVPTIFISGMPGQFYREFAVAIAASTVISAFNSLTLSPALAALMLRAPGAPRDPLQRALDALFGWFFRGFNRGFGAFRSGYAGLSRRLVRKGTIMLLVYGGLLALTWKGFEEVPAGFIPNEDQGFIIVFVQLPDAASLERTDAVVQHMSQVIRNTEGVRNVVAYAGFSAINRAAQSNVGTAFVRLLPFAERVGTDRSSANIIAELRGKFAPLKEAVILVFPPPPIRGLSNVGGFKLQVQDRADRGPSALQEATQLLVDEGNRQPQVGGLFSSFRSGIPQVWLDIDREQARQMGVPLDDIFSTLQVNLGSLYVNDFNRFGRVYRVTAQADAEFRAQPEDVLRLKTRNAAGQMVPLGALLDVREVNGPDRIVRYNLFPAAELTGNPKPGVSTGEAIAAMDALADAVLPPGFGHEWTELSYQQVLAGNTALFVFPLCVLFVFLALAAQYESWSMPLSVILIVPMCLLSAIAGLWFAHVDNNILTQIGFVVLVGLACKNAILIVQFARVLQERGMERGAAAVEAARLRLRPILMTSFSFIFGVLPLALAEGAGAESRQAIGIAMVSGMLGVTIFGLLFTPVFYTLVRRVVDRREAARPAGDAVPERG